jgi:hypothetical protein
VSVPLQLINLDDLSWEDLTAEGRSLIPARSSAWTNHNPSDPGITLIELFAYISESLMYELNRISAKNIIAFLRLINGPGWDSKDIHSLQEEKRAAVLNVLRPHRAVTAEDFEALALAVPEKTAGRIHERVARAKCIFGRNLDDPASTAQVSDAPGHVSLVIVPGRRAHPSPELIWRVKQALEPARLLTTRVHVVRPRFMMVGVAITLVPRWGADPKWLQNEAVRRLERFFDPLHGGFEGTGWPFGRSVYVSEVYQLLASIPGVDYVTRSKQRNGPEIDELAVGPSQEDRVKWNKQGELEAIELRPDELVSVWIDANDITIAPG